MKKTKFYHIQKDNSSNLILFKTRIIASSKPKKSAQKLGVQPMTISETKEILKIDLFKAYVIAVSVTISIITILSILKSLNLK